MSLSRMQACGTIHDAFKSCPALSNAYVFRLAMCRLLTLLTDIQCYDVCPYCDDILRNVHQFVRHECEHSSDNPKDTYMRRRVAHLNKTVNMELERLQSLPSHTRKRAHGVADSDSIGAQKKVKTTQNPLLPANTPLQSHLPIACSDEKLTTPNAMKVTATSDTDEMLDRAATMIPSNAQLIFSSETTLGIPANDDEWAFTNSTMHRNDGGWAFAETAPAMPSDDGGWDVLLRQ